MIGTNSCVLNGFDSSIVRIEGNYLHGYSGLSVIGQFNDICRDGKERALAALEHLGLKQPSSRIVLSLCPADIKGEGSQTDLAFAVTLAQLFDEKYRRHEIKDYVFLAELGLDGELKASRALLPMLLAAFRQGYKHLVIDAQSAECLAAMDRDLFQDGQILVAKDLGQVLSWLEGQTELTALRFHTRDSSASHAQIKPNFDDMVLSPEQKSLAMTIALGQHHCLLSGPPGCGKSMFAARIGSLLPPMNRDEHLQSILIRSYRGSELQESIRKTTRPFRAPHHSASMQAMTGSSYGPGEFALAHHGVLFMDEIAEFRRDVLESLREPLENAMIHVARSQHIQQWPAAFILIAARNPCHCGYFGSKIKRCRCTIRQVQSYQQKLSGPIMDRIDIHFSMPEPLEHSQLFASAELQKDTATTALLREQIAQATDRMRQRNQSHGFLYNSGINGRQAQIISGLGESQFNQVMRELFPTPESSRSTLKILRVARSLADLDDQAVMAEDHLAKALAWHKSCDINKAYGL